jgi:hypothetical protein
MLNNHEKEMARLPSLIEAAERGDLDAQHDLAAFYATDELSGLKNEAEAVKWYTRAAEREHALSQYDLGFMLLLGEGTEKDVAKGLWWMEQAVANGWEYAARLLSDVYTRGFLMLSQILIRQRTGMRGPVNSRTESNNSFNRSGISLSFMRTPCRSLSRKTLAARREVKRRHSKASPLLPLKKLPLLLPFKPLAFWKGKERANNGARPALFPAQ